MPDAIFRQPRAVNIGRGVVRRGEKQTVHLVCTEARVHRRVRATRRLAVFGHDPRPGVAFRDGCPGVLSAGESTATQVL